MYGHYNGFDSYGGHIMGGWMLVPHILGLLLILGLIIGLYFLLKHVLSSKKESALELLQKRYVNDEISSDAFREKKQTLRQK